MPREDRETPFDAPPTLPSDAASTAGTLVPLAFVALTLLLLAVVPIGIRRQAAEMRTMRSELAEPARRHLTSVQLAVARQMSALRGYLVTGDDPFLERYAQQRRAEESALAHLYQFARRLHPDVLARVRELERELERWHSSVDEAELLRRNAVPQAFVDRILLDEAQFDATLAAAQRADQAIVALAEEYSESARRAENRQVALTIALVLAALCAAFVVGWFAVKLLRLAAGLRQRALEEARFRKLTEELNAATTANETVRVVVENVPGFVSADGVFAERIDWSRNEVEVTAAAGSRGPHVGSRAPLDQSLSGLMMRKGSALLSAEVAAVEEPLAPYIAKTGRDCRVLALPLETNGDRFGTLALLRPTAAGPFPPRDEPRIETLCQFAAIVLRRVMVLEESEQRRQQLSRVLESKGRWIRGLSHDLKNPLGVVSGYAELLASGVKGRLSDPQLALVHGILHGADAARRIIDDLLTLAGAETGQVEIRPEPIDVGSVVRSAVDEHRPAADKAGLEVEVVIPDELPVIQTDPARLRQVLGNLLSNAVKYTPSPGHIRVSVEVAEDGEAPYPGRWVAVHVSDTGRGIPEPELQRVFEEFHRVSGAGPGEPGTGLGLAISRTLTRLLNGEVTVESTPGIGSTFTVWLPLDVGPATTGAARRAA